MSYKTNARETSPNNWLVDITVDINDASHVFVYNFTAKNATEAEETGLAKLKEQLLNLAYILPERDRSAEEPDI